MLHPLGTSTWAWNSVYRFSQPTLHLLCLRHVGAWRIRKTQARFQHSGLRSGVGPCQCQLLRYSLRGSLCGRHESRGRDSRHVEMAVQLSPNVQDKLVLVGCPVWDAYTAKQQLARIIRGLRRSGIAHDHEACKIVKEGTTFAEPQAGVGGRHERYSRPGRCLGGRKTDEFTGSLRRDVPFARGFRRRPRWSCTAEADRLRE